MAKFGLSNIKNTVFGDGPVAKAYLLYLTNDSKEKEKDRVPVQFNPTQLTMSYGVEYSDAEGVGKNKTSEDKRAKKQKDTSLTVELYLDSASVIKNMSKGQRIDKFVNDKSGVWNMLSKLSELVDYKKTTHHPYKVAFCWGKFKFKGVVSSMSTTYQMFDREGNVVQATVSMTIEGREDKSEHGIKRDTFESPDRTKYRSVGPADELWMLAYDEYDDSNDWRAIAKENKILNPRKLDSTKMMKLPAL